jgi:tryptophan-rich sensory protein
VKLTLSLQRRPILVAALSAIALGAIGGTITTIGPWYHSLATPAWKPPDWSFGVIWTAIFACAAASGVFGWRDARTQEAREWMIGLFALNGFLNIFWSLLFFRLQRPDWAVIEVGALWLSVALLLMFNARLSRLSGLLIAPYLIWVSIAGVLNYDIVRLNPPFH